MSILIVEDNPINMKILELNLKKHGYEILTSTNGKEALEKVKSDLNVQLVITDILMPKMDGLDLLSEIKKNPDLKDIPVIVCSALKDLNTVDKAVKMGCASYMVKPVIPGMLLQKVREMLGDEKMVLQDKYKIMLHLNMDDNSYIEIAKAFERHIENTMYLLNQKRNRDSDGGMMLDLKDLLGGSSLLGADILHELLKKIMRDEEEHTHLSDRNCTLLMEELNKLRMTLELVMYKSEKNMEEVEKLT